jgi:hypothetical protein
VSMFRYVLPKFRQCYEKFCKEKSVKPNIVTFKSGFEAFWMGNPDSKYVFIYFHGKLWIDPTSIPSHL